MELEKKISLTKQRLIIVSNRLPFRVVEEDGHMRFRESAGGLVTGLSSFLGSVGQKDSLIRSHLWVGWPGRTIDETLHDRVRDDAVQDHGCVPVFLSQEEMDEFYLGFCNKTIWPLFHYFPTITEFDERMWAQYVNVNESFAESVLGVLKNDDIVWVHDYHLMLLPRLLKQQAPDVKVGFFLHIPFPSYEVFRLLPVQWRREILEGLLGADLVGFHTYEYTRHFLQCVLRVSGHENNMGQIHTPERTVQTGTYPMGVDSEQFAGTAALPAVREESLRLRETFGKSKVILSVDRLDYTKGILNRLQAFQILLDKNPDLRGNVILLMIVVPSRIGVDQYELMKKQIEELVGGINGKFGQVDWTPVIYQYRHVPLEPLVALYAVSDVALVTPLRDGMNLVSKEYVASRIDRKGVLVLSEMAGAAKELGEALIINPNDRGEIALAMKQALEMPVEEQERCMDIMQNRIRRYNVVRWARDFVHDLIGTEEEQKKYCSKLISAIEKDLLVEHYRRSVKRLLLLDYDGTLMPFVRLPEMAKPSEEVMQLLTRLSSDPRTRVVVISGRDRKTLERWLGELPIGLAAEHGAYISEPGKNWTRPKVLAGNWKPSVRAILDLYADRLPGAMVEEKDYSLVWHYRGADPEQGRAMAGELTDHLVGLTANNELQVMSGNKVVEVRVSSVNKGAAGRKFMSMEMYDFILFVGDDWTDEDLFRVMPEGAYSIKVGIANTHARYNVRNTREVVRLLDALAATSQDPRNVLPEITGAV